MNANRHHRARSAGLSFGVVAVVCLAMSLQVRANPPGPWVDVVRPWLAYQEKRAAPGAQSPTEAIKELDQMLSSYHTGGNLTQAQVAENQQIKQRVLHGTFDVRELCRIALGRHWTSLPDSERERFVQLMISLLEEKGILSKEQGQKKLKNGAIYSITYLGDKYLDPIRQRALTRTKVYVKSHEVRVGLDYKLRRASDQWKIFDVIVDGSSLVENYQYQFDSIISKYGYPELVRRMEKKLGEIRAEKAQ